MARKVAIVGGGIGGLAAAYELSKSNIQEDFDITIYQMGWRLGGKCAAGRNLSKNMRIEEHGIHAFSGSYYNALTMMKHVFDELDRDPSYPIPDFESAFVKVRSAFSWDYHQGKMHKSESLYPPSQGIYDTTEKFVAAAKEYSTLVNWTVKAFSVLKFLLSRIPTQQTDEGSRKIRDYIAEIDQFEENMVRFDAGQFDEITVPKRWLKKADRVDLTDNVKQFLLDSSDNDIGFAADNISFEIFTDSLSDDTYIRLNPDGTARRLAIELEGDNVDFNVLNGDQQSQTKIKDLGPWVASLPPGDEIPWHLFLGLLTPIGRPEQSDLATTRFFDKIEILQVVLRGIHRDDIEHGKFHTIDHINFDDWLRHHGASDELMQSPHVMATLFTTYQFPDGDIANNPVMSASSYVQWVMRIGSYIDAAFYFFTVGSGETLIAPLYDLLIKRDVTVKLFHELTDVSLSDDGSQVETLTFNVQSKSKGASYDPYITVKNLQAWPNRPLYDQLVNGDQLKGLDVEMPGAIKGETLTLKDGSDFDVVILAIPPKALAAAAPSLMRSSPEWQKVANMPTTATQSMQLWLKKPTKELADYHYNHEPTSNPGQHNGDSIDPYFISANYRSGHHGICEFDDIIEFEDWPSDNKPEGLVYFSGVMTRPHQISNASVRELANLKSWQMAETMLISSGAEIFPQAASENPAINDYVFDFNVLFPSRKNLTGVARLSDQYIRGNALPSELYTQAPPGTKTARIDPLFPPHVNLTVAGDWVDTRLNIGSVEGAVIGGRLAACFVSSELNPKDIMGIQL